MNFLENIAESLGLGDFTAAAELRVVLLGDAAGYFENVRSVNSYSDTEITLTIKGGSLKVKGKGLYIKKYCAGDLAICGKITALERS